MKPLAIFCGGFYIPKDIPHLLTNTKSALSWANNTLQWAYIDGFRGCYDRFYAVSVPQIGAFPQKFKKPHLSIDSENENIHCCSFWNISFLKQFSRERSIYCRLLKILQNETRQSYIDLYIYDLSTPIINAAVKLRKQFPRLKLCVIVPDLPDLTGYENKFFPRLYGILELKRLHKLYKNIDAWILLSKFMTERIPESIENHIVIEGMINQMSIDHRTSSIKKEKIILYTGAVSLRNNCLGLAKAFLSITDQSARLIFCGLGDALPSIQELAINDCRIVCLGQLTHSEVLDWQKKSWLLVNPRQGIQPFTRYSFPSKLMEYYASGTPVLMYKIDGIPVEYYEHCFLPTNNSLENLSDTINYILDIPEEDMINKGKKAQDFILTQKSNLIQCQKAQDFMATIVRNRSLHH